MSIYLEEDKIILTGENIAALEALARHYNEEVRRNRSELDFTPGKITAAEMLELIIAEELIHKGAMEEYREELKKLFQ